MKTAGIIAEYNPFHNGHKYQLDELRRRTGADFVIIAMSGDFVQRGEPAIFDKYTRTRMALLAGADLVLELPAAFAASSAEDFAACGVALLDKLGVVELLCFGSECGDIEALETAAKLLAEEPAEYQRLLKSYMNEGDSFPRAREKAVTEYLRVKTAGNASAFSSLLSSPNNILGIEYQKALLRRGSTIKPYTILRKGQGYHEIELAKDAASNTLRSATGYPVSEAGDRIRIPVTDTPRPVPDSPVLPYGNFASASAIRRAISEGRYEEALAQMPHPLLPEHLHPGVCAAALPSENGTPVSQSGICIPAIPGAAAVPAPPIFPDDLSALLNYRLLSLAAEERDLTDFLDVSLELADRIGNHLLKPSSFTGRIGQLKTRQYTYTRISRALLHVLLGATTAQYQDFKANDYAPYARVLGFRKDAAPLLSEIKKNSRIPLITKTSDGERILSSYPWADASAAGSAIRSFRHDLYVSHLYRTLVLEKSGNVMRNEYTQPIVIL